MTREQPWENASASDLLEVKLIAYWWAWLFAAVTYLPILLGGATAEPVRPCRVVIRRRRDRAVVMRCRHFMRSVARDQRDYMIERLASDDVRTFCTEFRIKARRLA